MKRREFETALRAAAEVAQDCEFIVIGSQAVHASCRQPPAEVLLSQECDVYPKNRPETANLLDAQLGRASVFARQHGFYVDAVAPEIASLPDGWEKRLRPFRVGKVTALCLDVHDLLASKLAAGRLKDLEFVGALLKLRVADTAALRRRIGRYSEHRDRKKLRSRLQIVLQNLG